MIIAIIESKPIKIIIMKYQIEKKYTTKRTYEVEAESIEEAGEDVENKSSLYDDEEENEETFVDGEEWYND